MLSILRWVGPGSVGEVGGGGGLIEAMAQLEVLIVPSFGTIMMPRLDSNQDSQLQRLLSCR